MRPLMLFVPLAIVSFWVTPLQGQSPRFGLNIGRSFVGGSNSRALVETDRGVLTGADQAGLHVSGYAEFPIRHGPLSARLDGFYNRLTSPVPGFAFVGTQSAPMARLDRTLGLTGSLVLSASRTAAVAPYARLGAGLFASHLEGEIFTTGGLPVVTTVTANGTGLGFSAGAGLILHPWSGPALVLDWSYFQALNHTRGVGFMPISVGLRF